MKKEARNSGSEKAELPTYSADATEIKMVKQTKKSSEQVEKIHKYR